MHICYYCDYLLGITLLLPPSINLIGWPSCTPAVFSMIKKRQRTMQVEEDVNYFGRSMLNCTPVLSCGKTFAHFEERTMTVHNSHEQESMLLLKAGEEEGGAI
jgi:hypothetical protein